MKEYNLTELTADELININGGGTVTTVFTAGIEILYYLTLQAGKIVHAFFQQALGADLGQL